VSARTQALVLLIFGAALVRLASGSALLRYVRPVARGPVLAAGLAMLLLAGVPAALRSRDRRGSRASWLVLAPVVAIALIAPPALGVLTADRPPVSPPKPDAGFAALPTGDPVPIMLSDVVLRTVWGASDTLRGRRLRVIGFVARSTDTGFVLARLVITCCAADAEPYDLDIETSVRAPPTGTWVAVTARFVGPSRADKVVPVLDSASIALIAPPSDPYG
jgi:uncharacterized repeat protein (TIGR03943 family)